MPVIKGDLDLSNFDKVFKLILGIYRLTYRIRLGINKYSKNLLEV